MKRVLLVSPHFPPTNAPDMQRVRLVLPYLRAHDWAAEVLAVEADQVAAPCDPWLLKTLPEDVPVHRVTARSLRWARVPGFGLLARRATAALRRRGDQLLAGQHFDLVYFSTTQFGVHVLGPEWKERHGVPFVMDYQDPWVSDYYRQHPETVPPGGRIKYALMDRQDRREEARVVHATAGITSVSAGYIDALRERYPLLPHHLPTAVMPFPGDQRDFELATRHTVSTPKADGPTKPLRRWIYVGRGGTDLAVAANGLFAALGQARQRDPESWRDLRIELIGTSYARDGAGIPTLAPLAAAHGVADLVSESTDRIPYSETLRRLRSADALLILGSNDRSYTASKLYPYLLARRPLLGVLHRASSAFQILTATAGGTAVGFDEQTPIEQLADEIDRAWFSNDGWRRTSPLNESAFAPYSASRQAEALTEFWERCLADHSR